MSISLSTVKYFSKTVTEKLEARSLREAGLAFSAFEILGGRMNKPNTTVHIIDDESLIFDTRRDFQKEDRVDAALDFGLELNITQQEYDACGHINIVEATILEALCEGKSLSDVLEETNLSEINIRNTLADIPEKLGVGTVHDAALLFAAHEISIGRMDKPNSWVRVLDTSDFEL